MSRSILFLALLTVFVFACDDGGADGDGDADGDVGTDGGDADADGDGDADSDADSDGDVSITTGLTPDLGVALRDEGWLRGDLHQHSEHSDGDDSVATTLDICEYLTDELFLRVHPEYEGNAFDFMSITDHRTVSHLSDPGWVSDQLILVPGEEFGGPGHANRWGISEHVAHDPNGDGVTLDELVAAANASHDDDGLFSPNHPFIPGIPWPWDVRIHDSIEVWNSGWSLMSPDYTEEQLEAWEASHGPASPIFRRAIQDQGIGGSMQALRWYEAQLALGLHVALVGGSDRHTLLMPGFPTTWVHAETTDLEGVLQGLRDRHTFVSRGPTAAQVLMTVELDGETWQMGDAIPVAEEGGSVTVSVQVGRADGGYVQLIAGEAVESDMDLEESPLGEVVAEATVEGADFTLETTLDVMPGSWFYPMVFETLVLPDASEERAARVRDLALGALSTGEEDYAGLAAMLVDLVNIGVALGVDECDPLDWQIDMLQCVPADDNNMSTFFFPDYIDRAFNAVMEEGELTEWTMGAVGSAVRFEGVPTGE